MAFKCFLGVLLVCLAFEGIAGSLSESRLAKQLDALLRDVEGKSKQVEKRGIVEDCETGGYIYFGKVNKCLKFGDVETNTDAKAETYCSEQGGTLAVVDNLCVIGEAAKWLKQQNPNYAKSTTYGYFIDAHWNEDDNNWQYASGRVITLADTKNNWYDATTFDENSKAWGNSGDTRSCIRLMSNGEFKWSVSKCWNSGDIRYALCEK